MKSQKRKIAFTLIELLVVITIIGILAVGATTIYSAQIQKARDSRRITDVVELKGLIELAYNDNNVFPNSSSFSGDILEYSDTIPTDPKTETLCRGSGATGTPCDYIYNYGTDDGIEQSTYEISTGFESEATYDQKAPNDKDNGNDYNRYELGRDIAVVNTNSANKLDTTNGCEVISGSTGAIKVANTGCQ